MTPSCTELLLIHFSNDIDAHAWCTALAAAQTAPTRCLRWDGESAQTLDRATLSKVHMVLCGSTQQVRQALLPQLDAWQGDAPGPLSVFCSEPWPQDLPELVMHGLSGWWPAHLREQTRALAVCLATDRQRWHREAQTRLALHQAQRHLEERKWVDRAKTVLMQARSGGQALGEDDAFRLLRSTAMQSGLRIGEVSRTVFEQAQWAEAVNRAGQLRMLSQRLVKLAAQRLAGVDTRRARTLQHQASQRAQDNLSHLAALPPLAQGAPALRSALAATEQSWHALKTALELRQSTAALLATDACATQLLHTADTLTDALEGHGARRALHIVNLCGRQRMRAQRLAKTALLQDLASAAGTAPTQPGPVLASNAPDLVAQLDEFELALLELERAPLSTPDTRALLAQARDEWLRLLRGLRAGGSDEGRAALAGSADALLDVFEQLTAVYEHSLQVLMA